MSKETGGSMKGYRKLKVGDVIREGDKYLSLDSKLKDFDCHVYKGMDKVHECHQVYRPLTKKPAEKWTYTKCGDKGAYMRVGVELRGVIWSLKDAKLICKAVNKYLAEGGKNG